ncbi:hypothetical protein DL95DRAFT_463280 [Leptodontidium sp. 2 PMI_412]|nr:hypothetical protein DL95DRAFT_463280 [Leptodontidium sp. 2 PMI_412]
MSSFTNFPILSEVDYTTFAFLPSPSKHLPNPSGAGYASSSTIAMSSTHLANLSESSNVSALLPTPSKHLANPPTADYSSSDLLEMLSKHTAGNSRANYASPSSLNQLSTLALKNSKLQSQLTEAKQQMVSKDGQIEGYNTKGFISGITELKGKGFRVEGEGQWQGNLVGTGMEENIGAAEVILGLQRHAGDISVEIGMIQVRGGGLAAGDDGVGPRKEDLSGSETDGDDEEGGVTLEGTNTSIFGAGNTAEGSNVKNNGLSHGLQSNTEDGEQRAASTGTGTPEFDLAAAHQEILHLQNMPSGYGGFPWPISRPKAAVTNLAALAGFEHALKERLASPEVRTQLLFIIASHDVKLRYRHLYGGVQGSAHTKAGNIAAHSCDILVDMAHFALGNITDIKILANVYGEGMLGFLAAFATPGPCFVSKKEIQILNLHGSMFAELNATEWGWWSRNAAAGALADFRKLEKEVRVLRDEIDAMHGDRAAAIEAFEANEEVDTKVKEMVKIGDKIRAFRARGK